jgi:SAM-dependent methyltransferase
METVSGLRLDVGCGASKTEGSVGLDKVAHPGVDYVLDFETDRLPFDDGSVEYVFSSHCLEHLQDPWRLFAEISRICQDGARLEFWTPYGWENSAFVFGHRTFYNEDHYLHLCLWFSDIWKAALGKRWVLREIVYIIDPPVVADLFRRRINLDFALRYYKGIVREFGVLIDIWHDFPGSEVQPKRHFATNRSSPRYPLPSVVYPVPEIPLGELAEATAWLSAPFLEPPIEAHQLVLSSSSPNGLTLMRHLASRLRDVGREEGLVAMARATATYVRKRMNRARGARS